MLVKQYIKDFEKLPWKWGDYRIRTLLQAFGLRGFQS